MGRKSKKKEGSESSMTTKMKKYRRRAGGRKVISIIFDINVFKKIGICTYVLVGGRRPWADMKRNQNLFIELSN